MSYIISFILPLIYILLYTFSLKVIFKNKFEYNLPLTFIISAIIMYVSLYTFKSIYIGLIINLLICLIFPIYLIKNKYNFKRIKDEFLTNGLICFLTLYLIVYLYDLNRMYTRWDELSHWGKMVKEILRLDNFYSVNASYLLPHKDYPPMFSLMEVFYTLINGAFKESYLIRCIHMFEGSIILSIFNHDKKLSIKKDILKTILVFSFLYILTLLFDSEVFINSIYIDIPLSFLIGYILFYVFKEKDYNYLFFIQLSFMLIFVLLSKQVGLSFYLVILFMIIVKSLLTKLKFNIKKILVGILTIIVLPFAFLFSSNCSKGTIM